MRGQWAAYVWAQHAIEGTLYFQAAAQMGHVGRVRVRRFCGMFRPRSGGENCVSIGRGTRRRAP